MKKLIVLLAVIFAFGCGSIKPTQKVANSDAEKHILPPNTASNKYSKIRQGGNQ